MAETTSGARWTKSSRNTGREMEKLVYAIWRDPVESRDTFNARLLGPVAEALKPHVRGLRINVQDDSVKTGTSPRFLVTDPQMEAVVQMWVDSSWSERLVPVEALLRGASSAMEGWLVSESAILRNMAFPVKPGERTAGFSQMVFLTLPEGVDPAEWRSNWQERHTRCAVVTQSNFEYIQNLVVRPLTEDAHAYAGVVEECFPIGALADKAVYYDAEGDPARMQANEDAMMESCSHFIGASGCDCIPTSQYEIVPMA